MWDAENDDDTAFEGRVDTIVRELGDRAKMIVPEAVTPLRETMSASASAVVATRTSAPAPAPTPDCAPAPAPTPAPAAATISRGVATTADSAIAHVLDTPSPRTEVAPVQPSTSTTMHQPMSPSGPLPDDVGMVGSLAQLFAFMEQQQRMQMERQVQFEAQQEKQQAKFEALLEKRDAQAKAEKAELEQRLKDAIPPAAADVISDEQLGALQDRMQALHAAKLICEEELLQLEDIIADCIEALPTADVRELSVEKTMRMLRLMEKMQGDASLARQLRRKLAQ